ncbi:MULTISPECIES: ABC transporter substrate-binding protein [Roseomonadaceae]|uniref:ABC transporter substrate-binding protein n=1 Tax=Falsiroseomonas oleicola TaxID=2801474 RepID=A0ABS6H9G1_9PROT|nr:ABC transporter substrate-binding protein [Roseomonas oleicola]MBU8545362.1 ABC transporter substrate-binding protein [Roseomonas oleicola]
MDGMFGRRAAMSGLAGILAAASLPRSAGAQPRGTVTASLLGNLPNIHPWHVGNVETGAANLLAYSNLLKVGPDGTLVPDLAVALPQITDDGLNYTFELRRDVRFHNGDRLTADDVLYSYEQYLATGRRRGNLRRFISNVTKDGDHVVKVTLRDPWVGWMRLMGYEAAIVRRGTDVANEGATGENLYRGSRTAGCGPFIPKSFQADVGVEFEAFPDYFGGAPATQTIKLVRIPDAATQLANLRTGTVDIISNCPPKDFAPVRQEPGFGGAVRPSAGIFYMPMNVAKAPFDNVHLRRAVACAVDRDYICEEIYSGLVTASALPASPNEFWYEEDLAKQFAYDPDRAKFHLRAAGMPRGFAFEAIVPVPSAYVEAREAAVVMQANLAEVGIRMNIRQTDFVSMYRSAQNGDWQAFPHPSMQSSVEDYLIWNNYHKDGNQARWMGYRNPAYDTAVMESFRYLDEARKKPALRKVSEILVEDCPALWIGRLNAYHLWRADISGFGPRYSYFMDLTSARKG